MTYVDGFVAAVPQENKAAYLDHAREAVALFKDHGATRMVENWGDDVPEGKVTDFQPKPNVETSLYFLRVDSDMPSSSLGSLIK